jgi:predicted RNA binding protein YcfA (HicA-like mRNA interferase family)
MSPRLPSVTARQIIRVLEAIGFERIRQSGSHATFRHPDGRWTIVSIHRGKTIPRGTLRKILRDAGLTVEQFIELL